MASEALNINELDPSLRKRFYEPVVLLYCLRDLLSRGNRGNNNKVPDLETGDYKSPTGRFECFVNKLGQVCDSRRGGDTVTAFAILQTGSIEYRFAVNNLNEIELNDTAVYVRELLTTLRNSSQSAALEAKDRQDSDLFSSLIRRILAFNQPRLSYYIQKQLLETLDFCISICQQGDGDQDIDTATDLQVLRELAVPAGEEGLSPQQFAERARRLLRGISQRYRRDRFKDYMSQKTREDREGAVETPWTKLYHGLGRLESYSITVKVFLDARNRWPELFDDFQVSYIPSSEPGATPITRRTSVGITKRFIPDQAVRDAFQSHTNNGNFIHDLDAEIAKKTNYKKFKPIVHAEVNLCNDIIQDERHPQSHDYDRLRFFNEDNFGRYIGCSKPTCRLCELYFQAPSGPNMRVRSGHQNLYYKWRAPDVAPHDGLAGAQARNRIMEWMLLSIKEQATQTIKDRFVTRSRYDSNTYPSNPLSTDYTAISRVGDEQLASAFGQIALGDWDDEDEDGGARL